MNCFFISKYITISLIKSDGYEFAVLENNKPIDQTYNCSSYKDAIKKIRAIITCNQCKGDNGTSIVN